MTTRLNRRESRASERLGGRRFFGSVSAFTLIEMLVVVVVILILVSIGLQVGPAVLGLGEKSKTQVTLKNAQMLLDRFMEITGVRIESRNCAGSTRMAIVAPGADGAYGTGDDQVICNTAALIVACGGGSVVNPDTGVVEWTNPNRIESLMRYLAAFKPGEFDGTSLLDGWNQEIWLVCPGDANHPKSPGPYFVSAGADGRLGDVFADPTDPDEKPIKDQSRDNLYSISSLD